MAAITSRATVLRMEDVTCKIQKKYKNDEYYCTCCCIGLKNKSFVQSHYNSRKHKENEETMWIISTLQNLPTISADRLHVITDLVEGVYQEHAAAAIGQLEVRKEIASELQMIVQPVMPEVVVKLFGSSETGFALTTSDVNIFLDFPDICGTPSKVFNVFLSLIQSKSEIYDSVEENFFAWNKIPHIRLRHKKSGLLCEVRIMDSQPASIAALLRKYASIDERVVKLGAVFRHWAKLCQVDRQEDGHYPAHMFILMVVHFLQQRQPPVLPVLHELVELSPNRQGIEYELPFERTYLSDLSHLSAKWKSENQESLGALWYGLLRYYGLEFKIDEHAVSILQHAPLHKGKREWLSRRLVFSLHRLVVEDPCNKKSNLARAASLDKVMQYLVNSIKKTLIYFSGVKYHPFVNNEEDNLAASSKTDICLETNKGIAADECPILVEDADKYCNTITDEMGNICATSEELVELDKVISSGDLYEQDVSDDQYYLDEQGSATQDQELKKLDEGDVEDVVDHPSECLVTGAAEEFLNSEADSLSAAVNEHDEIFSMGNRNAAVYMRVDGDMYDSIAKNNTTQTLAPVETSLNHSPAMVDKIVSEDTLLNTDCENDSNLLTCSTDSPGLIHVTDKLSTLTLDSTCMDNSPHAHVYIATSGIGANQSAIKEFVSDISTTQTATGHPISYEFVAKNFAYQIYPVGCLTCKKLDHTVKECPEERLMQSPKNLTVPSKSTLQSLKQSFKSFMRQYRIDDEDFKRREWVCACILRDVRSLYSDAQLEMFGSSLNGFGGKSSDLDLCLKDSGCFELKATKEVLENIAALFRKHPDKYRKIIAITNTRVPIIKFYHLPSKTNCDISSENRLAMRNTLLLKTYADLDSRVQVLGYAFKHFAKVCSMADASVGGLSSYAYILMLLHYLQRTDPPVIPVLQQLQSADQYSSVKHVLDGWNCYFFEVKDQQELMHVWPGKAKNHEGIGALWLGLLRYYCEFDWQRDVVTIRQSEKLTKFDKWWLSKPMCIEDPFDLNHNLGQPVSNQMRQYILCRFQDALSYHSSVIDTHVWRDIDHVMDANSLGCDSRPPVRKMCSTCNQLGHKDVDCPSLGQKKMIEPRPIVRDSGSRVASLQKKKRPIPNRPDSDQRRPREGYYARKKASDSRVMLATPQMHQAVVEKQRGSIIQGVGSVSRSTDPDHITSVASTKSVPFTAQRIDPH